MLEQGASTVAATPANDMVWGAEYPHTRYAMADVGGYVEMDVGCVTSVESNGLNRNVIQ